MPDLPAGHRKFLTPILVGALCGGLGMILAGVIGPVFGMDMAWRATLGFVVGWIAGYFLASARQRRGGNSE